MVQGLGFRVQGLGCDARCLEERVIHNLLTNHIYIYIYAHMFLPYPTYDHGGLGNISVYGWLSQLWSLFGSLL